MVFGNVNGNYGYLGALGSISSGDGDVGFRLYGHCCDCRCDESVAETSFFEMVACPSLPA